MEELGEEFNKGNDILKSHAKNNPFLLLFSNNLIFIDIKEIIK